MHRFILNTITVAILVLAGSAFVQAAVEAPADMMLAPPDGMQAQKTPVAFSHAKHGEAKIECTSCHHTWDGKNEVKKCSTAGCHDQPGKKGVNSFYNAFHGKKSETSCLGCHKIVKVNGKPVPVSCKSCHPK